ncbi:hypothetical protein BGV52_28710 [Burkholderia ubonensis]|nr:hypothetical protein BGV52_28710 [Burkholderia ubonensis]OJB57047.1 hypothetical protein BGV61_19215 [Burkholderia ubonensis]
MLVRVQVRRVRRQTEQLQMSLRCRHKIPDQPGLVNRMAVEYEDHGLTCAEHQATEKFSENDGGDGIIMDHDAQLAPSTDCRNHGLLAHRLQRRAVQLPAVRCAFRFHASIA